MVSNKLIFQSREIKLMKSFTKAKFMLNKRLYEERIQESGHSFDSILLSSFDQLFYMKNMHLKPTSSLDEAFKQLQLQQEQSENQVDWTETIYIKGELLLKIIIECIINFHYSISKDVWNIFLQFLLFFRKRGSLSSDLSLLSHEFSNKIINNNGNPADGMDSTSMVDGISDKTVCSSSNVLLANANIFSNSFLSLYCFPMIFMENAKLFSLLGLEAFPSIKKSSMIISKIESKSKKFLSYHHQQQQYGGNTHSAVNVHGNRNPFALSDSAQQQQSSWWGNILGGLLSSESSDHPNGHSSSSQYHLKTFAALHRADLQPFYKYLMFAEREQLLSMNNGDDACEGSNNEIQETKNSWIFNANSFDLMEMNRFPPNQQQEQNPSQAESDAILQLIRTDDYLISKLFQHYRLKKNFLELFNLSNLRKSDSFFMGTIEILHFSLKQLFSLKNKENEIDLLSLYQNPLNPSSHQHHHHHPLSGLSHGNSSNGGASNAASTYRMNWLLQYERLNSSNDFFLQQEQQQNILLHDLFPLQYLTPTSSFQFSNKSFYPSDPANSMRGSGSYQQQQQQQQQDADRSSDSEELDAVFLLELLCSLVYESDKHWNYFGFKIYRKFLLLPLPSSSSVSSHRLLLLNL